LPAPCLFWRSDHAQTKTRRSGFYRANQALTLLQYGWRAHWHNVYRGLIRNVQRILFFLASQSRERLAQIGFDAGSVTKRAIQDRFHRFTFSR
jgi:hypothetical protein